MSSGFGLYFGNVWSSSCRADNLAADRFHHLRRERARRAVAACDHDFQLALELRALGEIGDVARREIFVELIEPPALLSTRR